MAGGLSGSRSGSRRGTRRRGPARCCARRGGSRLPQIMCTWSPAGTCLPVVAGTLRNSAARWRRYRELMTVPPAMVDAAASPVVPCGAGRSRGCARGAGRVRIGSGRYCQGSLPLMRVGVLDKVVDPGYAVVLGAIVHRIDHVARISHVNRAGSPPYPPRRGTRDDRDAGVGRVAPVT